MKKVSITVPPQGRGFKGNREHLAGFMEALKTEGVRGWKTRRKNNYWKPVDLRGIDLSGLDLRMINLAGVRLDGAKLIGTILSGGEFWGASLQLADMREANLDGAILKYANLCGCNLSGARLVQTDLTMAVAKGTNFSGANLSYANLCGIDLREKAILSGAFITGTNVWGIQTDATTIQNDLNIESVIDPLEEYVDSDNSAIKDIVIKADNLETAHLLYLVTRRERDEANKPVKSDKLKDIIDAMTNKMVLILGNFGARRKSILRAIRFKLAELGYAPVIFDFDKPKDRDLIETVAVLAGLSRFVIADFTTPRSTPLEALLIIRDFKVPFAPIIIHDKEIFAMFDALQSKYDWVLEPHRYKDEKDLGRHLKQKVVEPCEAMRKKIAARRDAGLAKVLASRVYRVDRKY